MKKIDRRRKPLLILECDSDKLTQQNLAMGGELRSHAKLAFPRNPIDFVQSYSEADLLEKLVALLETKQLYKNIVIIGHSNRSGLQISADRFNKWEGVADWIKLFEPHRVILLACEAGQWLPCAALFDSISTLKEIFGSPLPAHKNQQYIVLLRVLHILGASKEDSDLIRLMQFGNFLLTKGVMFRQTRAEYERGGDEEGKIWTDLAEPLLKQIMERFL